MSIRAFLCPVLGPGLCRNDHWLLLGTERGLGTNAQIVPTLCPSPFQGIEPAELFSHLHQAPSALPYRLIPVLIVCVYSSRAQPSPGRVDRAVALYMGLMLRNLQHAATTRLSKTRHRTIERALGGAIATQDQRLLAGGVSMYSSRSPGVHSRYRHNAEMFSKVAL